MSSFVGYGLLSAFHDDRCSRFPVILTTCKLQTQAIENKYPTGWLLLLLLVCVSWAKLVSQETASSSAEYSRDKPPLSFVRGQNSTMWDIVWVSPQGHRSVSVSRHFLLQAPQCPCSLQKRFSRDHWCRGRSKPGWRIVGSHTRWELSTWADFQLCLHRLLMSTGWLLPQWDTSNISHTSWISLSSRCTDQN